MGERAALSLLAPAALAGLLALAAAGGGDEDGRAATTLPGLPERPPHERIDLPSVAACGACHATVYAEWAESLHAGAWTNANVQRATRGFERESCRPCHSPLPVLPTGLDRPPEYRAFNREDGVHCLSCHGLADGVAAARTVEDAPCRPRLEPRLLAAELCWPCHEPTHQAFSEYETSDAFAVGVRCVDCHMPVRPDGTGRSHGPHGGMDEEFVRRALAWSCAIEGGELLVTLRNRTGHKFPGEIPSRSFLVKVEVAGEEEPRRVLLRKPHKGEEREDDRLLPDETRTLVFALPEEALRSPGEAVRVELLFLPLPLLSEDEAFRIGTWPPAER